MPQQEILLESRDVKSISEKLERVKPMWALISVGSDHIGNNCVPGSWRLGFFLSIWKNPLPLPWYTQCFSMLLVTENVSFCVHQHYAEENSQHQHECLDSPFWIQQLSLHRSDIVASTCLMTKKKVATPLMKRDYSVLPEQQHFFVLRVGRLKNVIVVERKSHVLFQWQPPSSSLLHACACGGWCSGLLLVQVFWGLFSLLCPFRSRSISGASSGLSTSPLSSPRVSGAASRSVSPIHSHMLDAFRHLLLQSCGS